MKFSFLTFPAHKYLYSQVQTQRTSDIFPHQKKFIVKNQQAIELQKHSVSKASPEKVMKSVSAEKALAFHYEKVCSKRICNSHIVTDKTAQQYGDVLWQNVDKTCMKLFKDGLCPTREK